MNARVLVARSQPLVLVDVQSSVDAVFVSRRNLFVGVAGAPDQACRRWRLATADQMRSSWRCRGAERASAKGSATLDAFPAPGLSNHSRSLAPSLFVRLACHASNELPCGHTLDDMSARPATLSGGQADGRPSPGSVGEQVRQLRVSAGLTQRQLAARIGSTQPAVAHLEAGRRTPTLATLQRLARALGRDVTLIVPCDPDYAECRLS